MKPKHHYSGLGLALCLGLVLASCGRAPMAPLPAAKPVEQPAAPELPLPDLPWEPPTVSPPQTQSMETVYAPTLVLDSQEPSPLTSVEAHMQVGVALKADHKKRQMTLAENISADLLARYTSPTLNNMPHQVFIDAREQRAAFQNTVYVNKQEHGAFTYLQYWFFYSFNDTKALGGPPGGIVQKCGNHEADWEHISLRINTQMFNQARTEQDLRAAIDDIYLSQHTRFQHFDRKWFRPTDPALRFNGTHLTVYPANGSHATYHAPGRYQMQNLAGFKTYDVNDGNGLRIETHQGNLVPLREQNWFKYAGRWGKISHDVCNIIEAFTPASNDGPYGPGHGSQPIYFYQSDWYGHYRPPTTPVPGYRQNA